MKSYPYLRLTSVMVLFAALIISGAAFAEKKSHGEKQHPQAQQESRDHGGGDGQSKDHPAQYDDYQGQNRRRFTDDQRSAVQHYYTEEFNHGRCPPGLAKKRNGCRPPGLAKQWVLGQPLAREVVYYDLPQTILANLGPPPIGHRYVRIAGDILLIAVGTSMVMDAIADLSSM